VAGPSDRLIPPRQARSRATLERALNAGVEILEEGDWEAFTVAEVCRRAGVAVGSLYSRFPTKHALLLAVQERILARLEAEELELFADPEWAALGVRQTIDRAVRAVVEMFRRHHVVLSILMARGAHDPDVQRHGSASARHLGEDFERVILTKRAELNHPAPELAVEVATRLLLDTLARRITAPPGLQSTISWDVLAEELVVVVSSYLLHTDSASTGPAPPRE
jgi:AcrR family transcriptional regulator